MPRYYPVDVMCHLVSLRKKLKQKLTAEDIIEERKRNPDFPSLSTVRHHLKSAAEAIKRVEELLVYLKEVPNVQGSFKKIFDKTASHNPV